MLDKGRLRTFLLGGAAGLLAGILIAPRSGRELRGSLADRAGEARERGREGYFDAQEQMRERLAERREGRRREPHVTEEDPVIAAEETETGRPHLRDVSRDVSREAPRGAADEAADPEPGRDAERSEELRRKVRATRERLRGRKDGELGPER